MAATNSRRAASRKGSSRRGAKTAPPATADRAQLRPPRLDAEAWIAGALDMAAEGGIEAVRIEPLAQALSVTKGSFYWHFADRRALIDALLAQWRDGRIAAIRQQSAAPGSAKAVLRDLADRYIRRANLRGLSIELAIRAFARKDERAAQAVRAVDQERLTHVARLFTALGWSSDQARARAALFYGYLFGQSLLDPALATDAASESAIDALLGAP
jgi:AcrR family transcriptional regulator